MVNRILEILLLIALIMMAFTSNGCMGSKEPKQIVIDPGDFFEYEFIVPEGNFINSSTFFLYPNKTVKVIYTVVNVPGLEVVVPKDISGVKSKNGPGIDNLVVIGNTGSSTVFSDINKFSNISHNVSYSESSVNKKIQFEFAKPSMVMLRILIPGNKASYTISFPGTRLSTWCCPRIMIQAT